jgi:hypothetical protein
MRNVVVFAGDTSGLHLQGQAVNFLTPKMKEIWLLEMCETACATTVSHPRRLASSANFKSRHTN